MRVHIWKVNAASFYLFKLCYEMITKKENLQLRMGLREIVQTLAVHRRKKLAGVKKKDSSNRGSALSPQRKATGLSEPVSSEETEEEQVEDQYVEQKSLEEMIKEAEEASSAIAVEKKKKAPLQAFCCVQAVDVYVGVVCGGIWTQFLPNAGDLTDFSKPRRFMLHVGLREWNFLLKRKTPVQDEENPDRTPYKYLQFYFQDFYATNLDAPRECQRSIISCTKHDHNGLPVMAYGQLRASNCETEVVKDLWEDARIRTGIRDPLNIFGKEEERMSWVGYVRIAGVAVVAYAPLQRKFMSYIKRGKWFVPGEEELKAEPSLHTKALQLMTKLQRLLQKLGGAPNTVGMIEIQTSGVALDKVELYTKKHLMCQSLTLPPLRISMTRSGNPPAIHMQVAQRQIYHEDNMTRGQSFLEEYDGNTKEIEGQATYMSGSKLMPWPLKFFLTDMSHFFHPEEEAEIEEREEHDVTENILLLKEGCKVIKFGQNAASTRIVRYDDAHEAIVWASSGDNRPDRGMIPISHITDLLEGCQTPVLKKRRFFRSKRPDLCFSIVSDLRTLDIQAPTSDMRDGMVEAIRALVHSFFHFHE